MFQYYLRKPLRNNPMCRFTGAENLNPEWTYYYLTGIFNSNIPVLGGNQDNNSLYNTILSNYNSGKQVLLGTLDAIPSYATNFGIRPNHVYLVTGFNSQQEVIYLSDPHDPTGPQVALPKTYINDVVEAMFIYD